MKARKCLNSPLNVGVLLPITRSLLYRSESLRKPAELFLNPICPICLAPVTGAH